MDQGYQETKRKTKLANIFWYLSFGFATSEYELKICIIDVFVYIHFPIILKFQVKH